MLLCRSKKVREDLIKRYSILPIAHVKLLKGQERKSCTGNLLTDSYYVFSYQKDGESKSFLCGIHAAYHFLELIKHPKLPLFDPLSRNQDSSSINKNIENYTDQNKQWHPAAKQLYNAIHLLIICWKIEPKAALKDIKSKLEKTMENEPDIRLVKAINTIISRDISKRTIQEMIQELRVENENMRTFHFDLLTELLLKNKIEQSFYE
ncbi:hypothetical protein PTI45_00216 [Paenibacillus nuruki]|uniref:Uncharacterized protein n=1 Tax=Paenibacillus nuruki TaxID=1886670 RepID=A0A1E3L9Q9_9BACL|nr:hypothetical protein [Paenibacillus nuruki]ODP30364.1 hypothetical protein PTI45_00216 [Paenibacillus nuruki]